MRPVAQIDADRCCGCTQCRLVCPAEAVVLLTARCHVAAARCTGCGRCVGLCPLRCIALVPAGTPAPR